VSGDLFEIMVAIGIILVGLLGGRRKKPRPTGGGGSVPPRRPPPPPQPADQSFDIEDIERIILGRAPQHARVPLPTAEPDPGPPQGQTGWEEGVDRSATSLETLDRAGGASHERFHHLYMQPPSVIPTRQVRPLLAPAALRQAIIWREILGPPKGLDD